MRTFHQPQHEDSSPSTDVNDYYSLQQSARAECLSSECLQSRYDDPQTANMRTEVPTLTELQHINTVANFDAFNNPTALRSSFARSPNLTEGTVLANPHTDPSLFLPQDQYVNSNSGLLMPDSNDHVTFNLLGNMSATQDMPELSNYLASANDVFLWDGLKSGNRGLQSLTNNSFPDPCEGGWERTADTVPGYATNDIFFKNSYINTTDMGVFYNPIFNQTPTFPLQPPAMAVNYEISTIPWPTASSTSGDSNLLFQSVSDCNVVDEGRRVEVISRPLLNGPTFGELPPYAANSQISAFSNTLYQHGSHPLPLFTDLASTRALARLEPKLTTPLDTPAATGPKANALQGAPKLQNEKTTWSLERKRRTHMMRLEGACIFCRLRKIRCSGLRGEVCKSCVGESLLCIRNPIPELRSILCPDFAFEHLKLQNTERWLEEGRLVLADDDISIKVSLHPHLGFLTFKVHEILSASPDYLSHPDLSLSADDDIDNFVPTLWLPFALPTFNIPQIKSKCEEYIKSLSKCPIHILENLDDNTSMLVWRSLRAVYKFLESNLAARQDRLLYNSLKLYWTLFSMGGDLNLDTESTIAALKNLQNPLLTIPSQSYMSARVFARQVKTAMSLIYQDLLAKVLEGLYRLSKSDTLIDSAISFCTNIVLCFIVEELETVIDGLGIYKISQGEDPVLIPQKGGECCKLLEKVLTNYSWAVFFKKYRKYHVIRNGCPPDNMSGQNEGVAGLSEDICEMLHDFEDEIREKADMTYVAASATLSDHEEYCTRNSGRQTATFLQKFY